MARGGSVGRLEVGDAPDRRAPPVGDRVRDWRGCWASGCSWAGRKEGRRLKKKRKGRWAAKEFGLRVK
jgi:hypothetical protein